MGASPPDGTPYRQREAKSMNTTKTSLAAFLVLLAVGAWAATPAQRAIEGWPTQNKQAAQAMIDKYGQPDSTIGDRLEWNHRGAFKQVAVDGRAAPNAMVENTVSYPVSPSGVGLLSLNNAVVKPDADSAQLTACSRSERDNVLALNVADGVMHGRLTADQARNEQERTIQLQGPGKSTPAS